MRKDDVVFLALALWREARGESVECRKAIAAVVMARANAPGWWGRGVMGVLFQKWQFSSLTDPKDAQLTFWPKEDDKQWLECMTIAEDAVGHRLNSIKADHYHDVSIKPPKWADESKFVKQIDRVRFYNLRG